MKKLLGSIWYDVTDFWNFYKEVVITLLVIVGIWIGGLWLHASWVQPPESNDHATVKQTDKISRDAAREIGADRTRLTALEKDLADLNADNAAVQDWISDLNDLGYDVGTLPPMVEVKQ